MIQGVHLTGLDGTNPLGFLAALGVQVLFESEDHQPRLWWTEDVIPYAVIDPSFEVDRLVLQALDVLPIWLHSSALNPGTGTTADNDAKFEPERLRSYLAMNKTKTAPNRLASCLVAEGSYAKNGKAKPSDLYLSAGRVAFLRDARKILRSVKGGDIENALLGPWHYYSKLPSLRWDMTDDPDWALAATKPGVDKRTCPGVEALALLGFSLFPVFGKPDRTMTQNCEGGWAQGGKFGWPLWSRPLNQRVVRTVLAHVSSEDPALASRAEWFPAWGIHTIMQSDIRRSVRAQGLGNMGPSRVVYPTASV